LRFAGAEQTPVIPQIASRLRKFRELSDLCGEIGDQRCQRYAGVLRERVPLSPRAIASRPSPVYMLCNLCRAL